MSDLIDRQTAIERIVKIRPSTPKQSDYSHGVDVGMAMAIVAIKEQPSAQPEVLACGSGELVQESDSLVKDCISRQAAIDAIRNDVMGGLNYEGILKRLPSAQSEMIREIRKWINSGNRGSADYFIVDKIEEIINKYE